MHFFGTSDEIRQRQKLLLMFDRLKAKATNSAQMRAISRTSWRDRILLGTLSIALGKMGVAACSSTTYSIPAPGIAACTNTIDPTTYATVGTDTVATPATIQACTGSLNPNAGCAPAVVNVTLTTRLWRVPCPGGVVFIPTTSTSAVKTAAAYSCYFSWASS